MKRVEPLVKSSAMPTNSGSILNFLIESDHRRVASIFVLIPPNNMRGEE